MTQGIYEIYCLRNRKRYIGSSRDIEKRFNNHILSLDNGIHHNKYLQKAWDIYGENEFVFSILEAVEKQEDLFKKEEKYIKKFKFNSLFNIMRKPGAIPRRTSNWEKKRKEKEKQQKEQEFVWGV